MAFGKRDQPSPVESADRTTSNGSDFKSLPSAAEERISRLRNSEAQGAFTSDLTVDEHLVVTQLGFEPVGYVMGTSIYHVGLQVAAWNTSQELNVLSQAMYNARELAIERMRSEADALGADGVIGVHLDINMYAWGQDVLEFVAQGTAVRATDRSQDWRLPTKKPFTSDLSGQQFYTLVQGGHFPVEFVMGSCVYHVAHQKAFQAMRQSFINQEITQFTEAVYSARELAMTRMQAEADAVSAHSIVGVRAMVSNHIWGEHATEFLALGTAVRKIGEEPTTLTIGFTIPLDGV